MTNEKKPDSAASALSAGLERTPSPEYLAFKAAGCDTVADKQRWDAAVAFEREACAKVADEWMAANIADAIRMRSNA